MNLHQLKPLLLIPAFFLLGMLTPSLAGTAVFQLDGGSLSPTITGLPTGVTVTDLTIGTGMGNITDNGAATGTLRISADDVGGSSATALTTDAYLSFSVTIPAGVDVNFTSMSLDTKGTQIFGYSSCRLYSSVHGFANMADIILIHAGHNNDATVDTVQVIIDRVETAVRSIITTARTHNPKAIILLAQVITSAKLPKYSYIPALNTRMAEVALELHTATQPIIIVDHATGWDPGNHAGADTVSDLVHPSAQGANKMANQWSAALAPLLD